jgi:hypothetical protein
LERCGYGLRLRNVASGYGSEPIRAMVSEGAKDGRFKFSEGVAGAWAFSPDGKHLAVAANGRAPADGRGPCLWIYRTDLSCAVGGRSAGGSTSTDRSAACDSTGGADPALQRANEIGAFPRWIMAAGEDSAASDRPLPRNKKPLENKGFSATAESSGGRIRTGDPRLMNPLL